MKRKIFISLFIFLLLLVFSCKKSEDPSGEITSVLDVEECVSVWVAMWNSYDLSQVDELFIQNTRLTYFSSEKEGAIIGIDSVKAHHVGFGFVEGGKEQENQLWLDDVHTEIFGSCAVVTGIWFFQKPSEDLQRGPVTFVYVKEDGKCLLAHLNFGNYPDSN
ncbi:hypothetical protein ACFL7D_10650 [candidate division KSB1 bacterium]